MKRELPMRTEDDLRAAFQLAAQQAPSTEDVLPRLVIPQRRRLSMRWPTWAPLAATAAILIAIVVPVVAITHNNSSQNKASSSAGRAVFGADASAASSAAAGQAAPEATNASAAGTAPGPLVTGGPAGQACTADEVRAALTWTAKGTGLSGALTLTNHSLTACTLDSKPSIMPIGADGKALDVPNLSTTEARIGPSRLLPGASASALLSWAGWCGPAAGTQADVSWGSGIARVTVSGPTTPSCAKNSVAGVITSGWFNPLS